MPNWKGIIGRGFRSQEFIDYMSTLIFSDWRPQFVVVHNTAAPKLSQWHSTPGEQRMKNLEDYYKNKQKWSAGPHLFIADDLIWVFTALTTSGVHSPSWNAISWGVEMVGDFDTEPFNPGVRENTVDALATLHALRGLDPVTIRFHKEDPKTTHKNCPGKHVDKADLVQRVQERMASRAGGEHSLPDNYLDLGATFADLTTVTPAPAFEIKRLAWADILSTEFGGGEESGMDSAYVGKVNPDRPEASLPARVPDNRRQIRVFNPKNGKLIECRVNDVGPWNTNDPYWDTGTRPMAEAQFAMKKKAQNGRVPTNPAGLDLTPAAFDALDIAGAVNTRQARLDWEFIAQ